MNLTLEKLFKNKKLLLIAGASLGVLIVAIIFLTIRDGSSSKKTVSTTASKPTITQWIKPDNTVLVQDYRYYSPCQVLPQASVATIFGKMSGDANTLDKFLDHTVLKQAGDFDSASLMPQCEYDYSRSSGQKVVLATEQYYTSKGANYVTSSLGTRDDEVSAMLDRYSKLAKASNDSSVKKFVATMQSSFTTYKQAKQDYTADTSNITIYNNLLIPSSSAVSQFEFKYKHDNVVYALSFSPTKADHKAEFNNYSDAYVTALLKKIAASFAVIKTNANNSKLSQSPSTAVIGTSQELDSTLLLDSCAVMNVNTFATMFGLTDNTPSQRISYNYDATNASSARSQYNIAVNSCGRTYRSYDLANQNTVTFTFYAAPSAQTATDWAGKFFGSDNQQLQSNADWTISYSEGGSTSYSFRVGPYVGNIFTSSNSGDTVKQLDQATAVAAINQMVTTIKQQAKL